MTLISEIKIEWFNLDKDTSDETLDDLQLHGFEKALEMIKNGFIEGELVYCEKNGYWSVKTKEDCTK